MEFAGVDLSEMRNQPRGRVTFGSGETNRLCQQLVI
jgi:hypothetical protein